MKYLAIATTALALGVALSSGLPADARERGAGGVHGIGGAGIGAGQAGMRGNVRGSRNFHVARRGEFGSGRLNTGRSVFMPSGGLFQDYSDRSADRAGYDRGLWPRGVLYPLAAVAAGLGFPYYGNYGYGDAYNPGHQTGGYTLAPAAAEYSYGNYCATDAKTCLLYGPAVLGVNCSCRMPGGRAYGSVVQ